MLMQKQQKYITTEFYLRHLHVAGMRFDARFNGRMNASTVFLRWNLPG